MAIILPYGEQTKLAADFKVSKVLVWKSLTYRADTQLARMLRQAAIERGGVEYNPERRKLTG